MPQDGKFKSKRQTHGSVLILLTERKAWEVAELAVYIASAHYWDF